MRTLFTPPCVSSTTARHLHTLHHHWPRHAPPMLSRVRPPRMPFRPTLVASHRHSRRGLFTETLPTALIPPAIFLSCFVGLWSYKIVMTIIFQNKFIYMPYMPPFARSEKMDDYTTVCRPAQWEEKRFKSLDGTRLSLCVASWPPEAGGALQSDRSQVVIVYFQGNGASMPPRLPGLTRVFRALHETPPARRPEYTLVALSYRGFWTSKGKASQRGIEKDAQATLAWVQQNYPGARIVLWGQSLGAAVAADLTARQLKAANPHQEMPISGLVLETPFVGIKEMLLALYPQKWLPYRYLWPFLRSWWDNEDALRTIAALKSRRQLPVQIVTAAEDEIVPESQAKYLCSLCDELRLDVRRISVPGALHNDILHKPVGRTAIVSSIKRIVE